jgi:Glycosyl transferase family 2
MSSNPAISVIMSVYNGAQYLYAAVQSILDQDFTDFEFIIVNDGSTDNSITILNDMAARDPRIRLISRENRGLVTSLNELIAAARAPYLARMDADDVAMPRRLSMQYAYLQQNLDIGVLGTNTHELDETGRVTACFDFYPDTQAEIILTLHDRPPLCHPAVMMRTDLIRSSGGYRSAFRHAEDYDLWLRLSRITQIRNLPDRLLLYRRSLGQVSERHAIEQSLSAQVAWIAHQNVIAGKHDPFDEVTIIPPLSELDNLLDVPSCAIRVQKSLVEQSRYAPDMLHGKQFDLMLQQAAMPDGFDGAWRTILRLLLSGEAIRAVALCRALLLKR